MWKVSWFYEKMHGIANFGATPLYYINTTEISKYSDLNSVNSVLY